MDQVSIVAIVDRAGVPYDGEPKFQDSYSFVRLIHHATDRSLNLGFQEREGWFIADFVFKREVPNEGEAKLDAFLLLFGGQVGRRATPFARLRPRFGEEALADRYYSCVLGHGPTDATSVMAHDREKEREHQPSVSLFSSANAIDASNTTLARPIGTYCMRRATGSGLTQPGVSPRLAAFRFTRQPRALRFLLLVVLAPAAD